MMEQYISNGYLKITNPQLQQNTIFNYSGDINNFDFSLMVPSQLKNFTNIEEKLNKQQIYFTEINIIKWNSQAGNKSSSRCKFIIKTSHPNLLWYKYDTEAPGGSNNLIYYKKQKIKTTIFTNMDDELLDNLIN